MYTSFENMFYDIDFLLTCKIVKYNFCLSTHYIFIVVWNVFDIRSQDECYIYLIIWLYLCDNQNLLLINFSLLMNRNWNIITIFSCHVSEMLKLFQCYKFQSSQKISWLSRIEICWLLESVGNSFREAEVRWGSRWLPVQSHTPLANSPSLSPPLHSLLWTSGIFISNTLSTGS